ncbi:MAG: RluA family pseudouridine synthase [Bacillota bacterium]
MYREDENTILFVNNGKSTELDLFLREKGLSGRMISKALKKGDIILEGTSCNRKAIVPSGSSIWFHMEEEESDMEPQEMDLSILYEDLDIMVLDKKPFILVHPTPNHPDGTLSNGVAEYFIKNGLRRKIRIVNRLDRDTSGVIIFAKNPYGHQQLASQMEDGSVRKKYLAVVHGIVKKDNGEISEALGKHADGIRQAVRKGGLEAVTRFKVLERFNEGTLLELELLTGRTHQIRVHLSHIGHPIMGDNLYSDKSAKIDRQALHAYSMSFNAPRSGESLTIKSNLPDDIQKLINFLKIQKNLGMH